MIDDICRSVLQHRLPRRVHLSSFSLILRNLTILDNPRLAIFKYDETDRFIWTTFSDDLCSDVEFRSGMLEVMG